MVLTTSTTKSVENREDNRDREICPAGDASVSDLVVNGDNESISEEEQQCLKDIISFLKENPHINARTDSGSLLYFIRGCKLDLERTKKKIARFYLMKAERTEWFTNRDPFRPEIQELLKIGVFLPLKEKDDKNRQVIIIRTAAHDPKLHLQNDVFKVGKMILDLLLTLDKDISFHGTVAIFDMNGVTLGHGLQMTPTIIKHSVESWQIYPCKLKMLEFVNAPIYINVILNTFRFFMTAKMKSRLFVRKNSSQVKTNLPVDLGGSGPSYTELAKYWKQIVENNADFYVEDQKYKTDISLVK